jgi:hypothetical protein
LLVVITDGAFLFLCLGAWWFLIPQPINSPKHVISLSKEACMRVMVLNHGSKLMGRGFGSMTSWKVEL